METNLVVAKEKLKVVSPNGPSSIYKYMIESTDLQDIVMVVGAEILTVQTQLERPCLWCRVKTDIHIQAEGIRRIRVIGTGHTINDDPGKYIGTYQLQGGGLVFHVFDNGWIE